MFRLCLVDPDFQVFQALRACHHVQEHQPVQGVRWYIGNFEQVRVQEQEQVQALVLVLVRSWPDVASDDY